MYSKMYAFYVYRSMSLMLIYIRVIYHLNHGIEHVHYHPNVSLCPFLALQPAPCKH